MKLMLFRVYDLYREYAKTGETTEKKWKDLLRSYQTKYPELYTTLSRQLEGELPEGWQENVSNAMHLCK